MTALHPSVRGNGPGKGAGLDFMRLGGDGKCRASGSYREGEIRIEASSIGEQTYVESHSEKDSCALVYR